MDEFDKFDLFMLNMDSLPAEISNRNPHFILITGNFNVKSGNWHTYDIRTSEKAHLVSLMVLYSLNHLITKPTHFLEHSSSCIDLTFTNKASLIRDAKIHLTLHPNHHHLIIYSKRNSKVDYLPPYTYKSWIITGLNMT